MYLCNRNTLLAAMVVTQPYFVDAADAQTVSAPTRDELQRDQIPHCVCRALRGVLYCTVLQCIVLCFIVLRVSVCFILF